MRSAKHERMNNGGWWNCSCSCCRGLRFLRYSRPTVLVVVVVVVAWFQSRSGENLCKCDIIIYEEVTVDDCSIARWGPANTSTHSWTPAAGDTGWRDGLTSVLNRRAGSPHVVKGTKLKAFYFKLLDVQRKRQNVLHWHTVPCKLELSSKDTILENWRGLQSVLKRSVGRPQMRDSGQMTPSTAMIRRRQQMMCAWIGWTIAIYLQQHRNDQIEIQSKTQREGLPAPYACQWSRLNRRLEFHFWQRQAPTCWTHWPICCAW